MLVGLLEDAVASLKPCFVGIDRNMSLKAGYVFSRSLKRLGFFEIDCKQRELENAL